MKFPNRIGLMPFSTGTWVRETSKVWARNGLQTGVSNQTMAIYWPGFMPWPPKRHWEKILIESNSGKGRMGR